MIELPRIAKVACAIAFLMAALLTLGGLVSAVGITNPGRRHDIPRVDLLKMDAEQSEEQIMAGLAEEDWPKIRQIVVEVHGGAAATRAMTALLGQRGFRTVVDPNPAMPTLSLVYGVRPT